ncbi:MAG: hypothetical protein E6H57_21390 [Betaproteobacteria bacterium]|nr:MAG: hypothetical protein E6H57_21390 [Betaproteobacteria bacterium]
MLAVQADGCTVETVEGLSDSRELAPLQKAFHEHNALQCGFCTPGMLMAAQDLVKSGSKPSRDEIRAHISGNYCRCTGYQAIVDAIKLSFLFTPPAPRLTGVISARACRAPMRSACCRAAALLPTICAFRGWRMWPSSAVPMLMPESREFILKRRQKRRACSRSSTVPPWPSTASPGSRCSATSRASSRRRSTRSRSSVLAGRARPSPRSSRNRAARPRMRCSSSRPSGRSCRWSSTWTRRSPERT